jgi:hypothetical protein
MTTQSMLKALAGATVALALVAPSTTQAAPKRTPLFMTLQKPPAPVVGTDGRRHLAYEFTLANNTATRAEVESIAVPAQRGRTLLMLAGAQISEVMHNFAFEATNALAGSEGGQLWLDVTLPRHARVPRALVNRLNVRTVLPSGETRQLYTFDTAPRA